MFATRLLLVSFAAAAAVLVGHTNAQNRCTTTSIGKINSHPQPVPQQLLGPGQADWNIQIQSNCQTVGVVMTACDTDVEPTVKLQPSLDAAWVHRNGQLLGYAKVDTTVYCAGSRRPIQRPTY